MVLVRCLVVARPVVWCGGCKNVHSASSVDQSISRFERQTGGKRVLLGVVERLDVAADLLHHGLALPGFPLDLVDAAEQLLDMASPAEGRHVSGACR